VSERVSERVIAERVPDGWMFDTLIVDEGQDFEPLWFDILGLFLQERHDVLWLEDQDQNLRDQPAVPLPNFVRYRTRSNYRSPQSIARFMSRTLPFAFEAANELPGLGVGVTRYESPDEQARLVARIIGSVLERGFSHSQIVVVTTRHMVSPGAPRSALDGLPRLGNYTADLHPRVRSLRQPAHDARTDRVRERRPIQGAGGARGRAGRC
jgi:hypothetical protein